MAYIKEAFIGFGTIGVESSKLMKVTVEIETELENKRNYTRGKKMKISNSSIKNEIEEIMEIKEELQDGRPFEFNAPANNVEIERWEEKMV